MDYQSSGVDIDAGNEVVRRIRSLAKGTFTPGVLSEIGSFGGLFSLASLGAPGRRAGGQRRRRRHQAEGRLRQRRPRHGRRGSRQPLRQRHPRPGRRAALLPRLPRHRQAVAGRRGRHRRRHGPRLPGQRLRAARRRDRGDAGLLSAGRVRPGRLHRRRRPAGPDDRRQGNRVRRRDRGAALERAPHQRLLAGAQDRVRAPRPDRVVRRRRSSARRPAPRCSRRTARTCRSSGRSSARGC